MSVVHYNRLYRARHDQSHSALRYWLTFWKKKKSSLTNQNNLNDTVDSLLRVAQRNVSAVIRNLKGSTLTYFRPMGSTITWFHSMGSTFI